MSDMRSCGEVGMGFMNGVYVPMSELCIPVTDLGFQLSDMCYDAISVHKGCFFRLNEHLDRWDHSVAERRYTTLAYDREQVADVLHRVVARAGLRDAMVTFVATRGSPATAHKDLRTCKNRFMAWAMPFHSIATGQEEEDGCDIVIANTMRIPPDSVDPTVKNFGRLDFVRALFEAYDRDAKYAVLLDADGNVTEGRGWNIFVVKGGVLLSPDRGALEGITRRTVLELSKRLNIEAVVTRIPRGDLLAADEVFMTSTAGGVIPIRSIDRNEVGDGTPGPVTLRLKTMYQAMLADPKFLTPVRYAMEDAA